MGNKVIPQVRFSRTLGIERSWKCLPTHTIQPVEFSFLFQVDNVRFGLVFKSQLVNQFLDLNILLGLQALRLV